jgi:hypothetical protein
VSGALAVRGAGEIGGQQRQETGRYARQGPRLGGVEDALQRFAHRSTRI